MSPQRERVPADQEVTEPVWRREACLHCGERLDPRTAMEAGRRMIQRDGRWVSVLPLRHAACSSGQ